MIGTVFSGRIVAALWLTIVVAVFALFCPANTDAADKGTPSLLESVAQTRTNISRAFETLGKSSFDGAQTTHNVVPEVIGSLEFAEAAIKQGRYDLAVDTLIVAKGMIEVAAKDLPNAVPAAIDNIQDVGLDADKELEMAAAGITKVDIANVKTVIERMAQDKKETIGDIDGVISRLAEGGFDVAGIEGALDRSNSTIEDMLNGLSLDFQSFESLAASLAHLMDNPEMVSQLSRKAGRAFAEMGTDLDTIAQSIASAVEAGASVDLESLAQGAGFDSFSEAVDAYNAAHGTNYSEQEAREALGM
ncbi:MAG: hypothetical protein ISR47_06540 [Rhodospirillales bacterium]|nr:hypothetical protein [Rhodospirillales bacterium]